MLSSTDARDLIQSMKRQLYVSDALRLLLLSTIGCGIVMMTWSSSNDARLGTIWAASAIAGLTWLLLSMLSIRQMRSANQATVYMASGRLDLAENQLITAAQQFSLYRQGKLLACHNLAVVAHGRRNYEAAANLCDGVLAMKGRPSHAIGRTSRILLADCRLSMGEPEAATRALAPLSLRESGLGLADQLLLLPIEMRSQVAVGNFSGAIADKDWKIKRAELLDSARAALVHALLAVACRESGDDDYARFLTRRAVLYYDLTELVDENPTLRDLILPVTSADNK